MNLPEINGRSSAQQFLEDHDRLTRELMLLKDEIRQQQEIVIETNAEKAQLLAERDYWRNRANIYYSYSVELATVLGTTIDIVNDGLGRAKTIAAEVTREKLAKAADEIAGDDGAAQVVQGMSARGGELPNSFDGAGR